METDRKKRKEAAEKLPDRASICPVDLGESCSILFRAQGGLDVQGQS